MLHGSAVEKRIVEAFEWVEEKNKRTGICMGISVHTVANEHAAALDVGGPYCVGE